MLSLLLFKADFVGSKRTKNFREKVITQLFALEKAKNMYTKIFDNKAFDIETKRKC